MAQFRTLTDDDVQTILRAVRAADHVSHVPIAAGTINTNVRVETTAGPLFLRINEGKSEDDVRREADIVAHAASRGVPTPAPLRTLVGDPFVPWNGHLASVFPWVPGRTLGRADVTPAHAAEVGRALAALHAASSGFPDHRPGRYEPDEIRRRFERVATLPDPALREAVATLGPELDALDAERAPDLPAGIIHGDLFIDNVLFAERPSAARAGSADAPRVAALLDFEQASWGRLAYDVAVTALAFAYGRDDFRPEVTRAFLDAYAAVRPPSAEERAALGAELRFAACRFAVTRITDVHLRRAAGAPPGKDFRRYLARLASVRAHLEAGDAMLDFPGRRD